MKYSEYKPLTELWLSSIPSHWSSRKLKYLFDERAEKGYPNEPLLVASQNMGVVPKNVYGSRTVEAMKDLHLLKLVKIGDFVISLRSFQGGIEYAYYQGIISPAYTIMIPRDQIIPGYFKYLAKSKLFIELLQICVTGIREGQNIDYNKLKNHQIPVPSREEQDQIVRYLDWQVSKINKLITAKKKKLLVMFEQIQLLLFSLNGQTTSIGSLASAFPGNWKMVRARRIFRERNAKGFSNEELLAVTQDRGVLFKKDCMQNYTKPAILSSQKLVLPDDFIISLRSFQGGIELSTLRGLVSAAYSVFYINNKFTDYREYYSVLFKSRPFIMYLNSLVMDIRDGKKISYNDFCNCLLPLPPESVRLKLHNLYLQYNCLRQDYEKTLSITKDLRNSLISDVVTGQADVRAIEIPDFEQVEETGTKETYDDENLESEEAQDGQRKPL